WPSRTGVSSASTLPHVGDLTRGGRRDQRRDQLSADRSTDSLHQRAREIGTKKLVDNARTHVVAVAEEDKGGWARGVVMLGRQEFFGGLEFNLEGAGREAARVLNIRVIYSGVAPCRLAKVVGEREEPRVVSAGWRLGPGRGRWRCVLPRAERSRAAGNVVQAAEETVKGLSGDFPTPASHWSGRAGPLEQENCSLWQLRAASSNSTVRRCLRRRVRVASRRCARPALGLLAPLRLRALAAGVCLWQLLGSLSVVRSACPSPEKICCRGAGRGGPPAGQRAVVKAGQLRKRSGNKVLWRLCVAKRLRFGRVKLYIDCLVAARIGEQQEDALAGSGLKFLPSRPVMSGGGGNSLSAAASAGRCSHASAYVRSRPVGRSARARSGQQAGAGESLLGRLWWGPEATKEEPGRSHRAVGDCRARAAAAVAADRARPVPVAGGVSAAPTPCCCTRTLCPTSSGSLWRSAFGYGHLTWEWQRGCAARCTPAAFALLFKLLQLAGADSRLAVAKLPRLLQACLAAVADFYLYRFSRRVAVSGLPMGLYYYPWPEAQSRKAQWKFALAVAAACATPAEPRAVRLADALLWHAGAESASAGRVLALYGATGLLVLAVSGLADKHYYGRWTLSQLNFLHYNLLSDIGSFYGVHPWHWYITQGIPAILGPAPAAVPVRQLSELEAEAACRKPR
uniref:Mannosyltransferase n=1 Tax=Macrostomum lignano TaxID=282301 RepID=A0A1I8FLD8_9PLAT